MPRALFSLQRRGIDWPRRLYEGAAGF